MNRFDPCAPPATRIRNGAQVIIQTLLDLGVDTVFGYPGGAVLPLYDALHAEPRLRHVLVRHEQAAVHAAEGYARTTGRVGVVFVTSGPGMSNTTTGLLDAFCDSVPVLCISGQVATAAIGTAAFQECDAIGISKPVTKWNVQVTSPDEIEHQLRRAFALAIGGRPGPVLVDVPKDVQQEPVSAVNGSLPQSDRQLAETARRGECPDLLKRRLAQAAGLICNARRPVLYGGGGLINAGPRACQLFADLAGVTSMPCTLTLMHPGSLVVCVSGDASILMNIQEMSTAIQHGAAVKVVLCNNGWMGMVRQWQELTHGGRYSQSYTAALPDFVALARAFGWSAARVDHRSELDGALRDCIDSAGPYLLDVRVTGESNCFPMIPAGNAHNRILLGRDRHFEGGASPR